MVDISRHGPGITVVEGGVWVTSTGTAYSEFAMIPWFSRRVMSEGINSEWNGSICEARKKKDRIPHLRFYRVLLLGFSVGCIILGRFV